MLIVSIEAVRGAHSLSEKVNLVHRITEAAVEVEGEPMRDEIIVKIIEIDWENWAVGGKVARAPRHDSEGSALGIDLAGRKPTAQHPLRPTPKDPFNDI